MIYVLAYLVASCVVGVGLVFFGAYTELEGLKAPMSARDTGTYIVLMAFWPIALAAMIEIARDKDHELAKKRVHVLSLRDQRDQLKAKISVTSPLFRIKV